MSELLTYSVADLCGMLAKKQVSSVEVTEAYLRSIERREKEIGAYITVIADQAMEKAKSIDRRRAAGERLSPLAGIPVGYKDNICTKGVRTTCASRMLEEFVPPYDACVTEQLEDCVLLGKLNMDEFAMGSTCETSYFHVTRNPRDIRHVAGGSSGGSAAAVAAEEAPFALGTDTGGSIRQPASFCGVVGMKPTYGAVSRYGVVAMASSLDQVGPVTKTVEDSAIVFGELARKDARDSTSVEHPDAEFTKDLYRGVKGMRFALPREFIGAGVSVSVREKVLNAAKIYEQLGATIEEVGFSLLEEALSAYYIISSAEASSNLACFGGINFGRRAEDCEDLDALYKRSRSEGFGDEVKRRILLGSFALSSGYYDAYYKKAMQVRTLIRAEFARLFETYSCILAPVAPVTAYRLNEKTRDPLEMYAGDLLSVPVNLAGLPAISIPCGEDENGLPVGLQLIAGPFEERTLYRAAAAFEAERGSGR